MWIKPEYYDAFQCTAEKCPMTCCQEWKISVDKETEETWETVLEPTEQKSFLSEALISRENTKVIGLNAQKKCPFLSEEKRCNLVTAYGEEILSYTCHTFPRQIHAYETIPDGFKHQEYALTACCPAVIDLWKDSKGMEFVTEDFSENIAHTLFSVRRRMLEVLREKSESNETELLKIFYLLKDLKEQEEASENGDFYDFFEVHYKEANAPVFRELSKAIRNMEFSMEDTFVERNELFLDMIENYRKEQLYTFYLEETAIQAEIFSGKLQEAPMSAALKEDYILFQKELKKYGELFRSFLITEIFADCLIPGGDLESMLVMTQWTAMEYAAMVHTLFLFWYRNGKGTLSYETIRAYMVILARMTGYDQEDIYEYMENSFESFLWDWGYFALLVGK